MKTLLLFGATGLVGQDALRLALADPAIVRVVAPTRRSLAPAEKLSNPIVDFEALPDDAEWWRADAAVCTLGTTLRQAGSRTAFWRIDHDFVLAAAGRAHRAGTPVFAYNSALGASVNALSFYLRVKGEIERDLAALGFTSLTLVRPSLLDGGKRREPRPLEEVALVAARCLASLVPPRYRAVRTEGVARHLLAAALSGTPGTHVVESERLHE
jgi:uncharacterized protein YbjT (DUF2867 family)